MKQLLFCLSFLFTTALVSGQTICEPDPMFADSAAGIYPPPFHPVLSPEGGIDQKACRNQAFEFVFNMVVSDSITLPPPLNIQVKLDSFSIATTGAILGLPTGFEYSCNPPSCVIPGNTTGCLRIFGTTADTAGMYDIRIVVKIFTAFTPTGLEVTVPDDPNQGFFPGVYTLEVLEEGDPDCLVVAAEEAFASKVSMQNIPNPFSSVTQVEIFSGISGLFDFRVMDLTGRVLHSEEVRLNEGVNNVEFDGATLANGIYIYSIGDASGLVSKKMIVNR